MEIRALTLHVMWYERPQLEPFFEVAKSLGARTVRVSVSPPPRSRAEAVIEGLRSLGAEYISAPHLYYRGEEVYTLVSRHRVYSSLLDPGEYMVFLKRIHERGEAHLSRYVSLLLGGVVYNSPYFPSSITDRRGLSVALLYPDDLKSREDVPKVLKEGEAAGMHAAASLGLPFLGVDASLSPWGHQSVARAIERLYGVKVGEWGTHEAIRGLNDEITKAPISKTGFNEVMLPLAEDEGLKALVWEGLLTLEKLVSYSAVCVPGLDMVPLYISHWGRLKRLLADLSALAAYKGRPIGIRVFPVDGDEFEVEGFGRTPAFRL